MAEKNSFSNWLGFATSPNWLQSRALGGFLGFALVLIVLVVGTTGILGLAKALILYVTRGDETGDPSAAARNIGLLLAAVFGAPFVAWQAIVRQKQADVAEQNYIADVLTKAGENLGVDRLVKHTDTTGKQFETSTPAFEIRSLGLLALERLARENLDYHIQVMEIIASYIRNNSFTDEPYHSSAFSDWRSESLHPLREDIETALRILERRTPQQLLLESEQSFTPRLNNVVFNQRNLRNLSFQNTDLSGSTFDKCYLSHVHFPSGESLRDVSFKAAEIYDCDLSHLTEKSIDFSSAKFHSCKLPPNIFEDNSIGWDKTEFHQCVISSFADCAVLGKNFFKNCKIESNVFNQADPEMCRCSAFENCNLVESGLTSQHLIKTFGDSSNALPHGLEHPQHWTSDRHMFKNQWERWKNEA